MTTFAEAMVMTDEQLNKLGDRHLLALFRQSRSFDYDRDWKDGEVVESDYDKFNRRVKAILATRPHVEKKPKAPVRREKKKLKY